MRRRGSVGRTTGRQRHEGQGGRAPRRAAPTGAADAGRRQSDDRSVVDGFGAGRAWARGRAHCRRPPRRAPGRPRPEAASRGHAPAAAPARPLDTVLIGCPSSPSRRASQSEPPSEPGSPGPALARVLPRPPRAAPGTVRRGATTRMRGARPTTVGDGPVGLGATRRPPGGAAGRLSADGHHAPLAEGRYGWWSGPDWPPSRSRPRSPSCWPAGRGRAGIARAGRPCHTTGGPAAHRAVAGADRGRRQAVQLAASASRSVTHAS